VLEAKVDERKNNADAEDPFRDVKRYQLSRGDLAGPRVESKKLVCSECVDGVHSNGKQERKPKISVSEGRNAVRGLEVPKTL
jgi:hypothetical protein